MTTRSGTRRISSVVAAMRTRCHARAAPLWPAPAAARQRGPKEVDELRRQTHRARPRRPADQLSTSDPVRPALRCRAGADLRGDDPALQLAPCRPIVRPERQVLDERPVPATTSPHNLGAFAGAAVLLRCARRLEHDHLHVADRRRAPATVVLRAHRLSAFASPLSGTPADLAASTTARAVVDSKGFFLSPSAATTEAWGPGSTYSAPRTAQAELLVWQSDRHRPCSRQREGRASGRACVSRASDRRAGSGRRRP
jgi:hypothetical protein